MVVCERRQHVKPMITAVVALVSLMTVIFSLTSPQLRSYNTTTATALIITTTTISTTATTATISITCYGLGYSICFMHGHVVVNEKQELFAIVKQTH